MPYSLLAPGPVNLHPEVLKILSMPMIHHRTPKFDEILKRVLRNLKPIFGTEQDVFIHTSTGSGGMESLLVNTLSPGDEVLVVVSGKFGERWAEMASTFGMKAHILNIEWGQAVQPEQIETFLKNHANIRAVLCQACETSTAVAHPISALGDVIAKYPSTLFLVDGITALGAYPLPMDEWKIDGLVGGSQKAFMLPTGLSFVSFSKKAWAFIPTAKCPRFYFDIRKEDKANKNNETFYSSSVSLIRALDFVLTDLLKIGLPAHYQEIRKRSMFTKTFAPLMGFTLYSSAPSDSLTALATPTGIDGQKLRTHLEAKYDITVMGGQDQLKGKVLRVGHMGYIQNEEMKNLIFCLGNALEDLGFSNVAPSALTARMDEWFTDFK